MRRVFASCLALFACQHWHYERNAPGHIDVALPPRDLSSQQPEEPNDPGEQLVVVAPGVYGGGGAGIGGPRGNRARGTAGVVTSVEYGWSGRSHFEDELFGLLPQQSIGLAVGWNFFEDDRGQRSGPLFLDLQYRRVILGAALGWCYDPSTGTQGPHAMAFLGPFYLDVNYLSDRGTVLDFGIMLRGALAWVWSR
jgi:hypothetical protein